MATNDARLHALPQVPATDNTKPSLAADGEGNAAGGVDYTLTEAARVVFTIHAKLPGRRVGGKCRAPTARNLGRRKCTRFVRRGAFAHTGASGVNPKMFSGKIGRKTLRPWQVPRVA